MTLGVFVKSIRLKQWVKNFFIFGALIFSRNVSNYIFLLKTVVAFFLFSLSASSIYLINDLLDYESDRKHPVKCNRPIASGAMTKRTAAIVSVILAVIASLGAFSLSFWFGIIILFYLAMNLAYTIKLKHVVIVDVMVIAFGFVLRVLSGAVVIGVSTSLWLLVCTTLLALFLALSKRRHELTLLDDKAVQHRKILKEYNVYLLDQMISVVTASTLMAYLLYTMDQETIAKFGSPYMICTFPFVLYGIFRYLYLVHSKDRGGNPTRVLLTDFPLLLNTFLWIVSFEAIIYMSL